MDGGGPELTKEMEPIMYERRAGSEPAQCRLRMLATDLIFGTLILVEDQTVQGMWSQNPIF